MPRWSHFTQVGPQVYYHVPPLTSPLKLIMAFDYVASTGENKQQVMTFEALTSLSTLCTAQIKSLFQIITIIGFSQYLPHDTLPTRCSSLPACFASVLVP